MNMTVEPNEVFQDDNDGTLEVLKVIRGNAFCCRTAKGGEISAQVVDPQWLNFHCKKITDKDGNPFFVMPNYRAGEIWKYMNQFWVFQEDDLGVLQVQDPLDFNDDWDVFHPGQFSPEVHRDIAIVWDGSEFNKNLF